MKKAYSRPSDTKADSDKAKRVYRAALDLIRRLDEISKQKKAYREVFMPEAITLRNQLQDYCERLMFYDALEYGRKAEELLWRKVYYDIIQLMKHNRKQMRPSSSLESAFRTHLCAASGYYHHLLFRLQKEYCLRLDGCIDFHHLPEPRSHKKPHMPKKKEPDAEVKLWAVQACHRCLVYLGDIARYQQDYDKAGSSVMSQRYYYQAIALCPDTGMPFNQLGTLAGTRYYNVDAAYYYLRCMMCAKSFEGAQGNLLRVLEKNRRRYQELTQTSPRDLPPDQQRSKDIKRFLVRFMHLLDVFHSGHHDVEGPELQECCQNTLQDFNLVMFYQPPHVTNPSIVSWEHHPEEKCQYLDDDISFKITAISMMNIYLLQKAGNRQVTAAIAFSLALFSHILNHAVIRLQSSLYEMENPRKRIETEEKPVDLTDQTDEEHVVKSQGDSSTDTTLSGGTQVSQSEGHPKNHKTDENKVEKKKRLTKHMARRRRRRGGSNSSSGSGESDLSDDSDHSAGDVEEDLSESEMWEESVSFLNHSDSTDTDSEDNLMVSQELRPGFGSEKYPASNNSINGAFDGSTVNGFCSVSSNENMRTAQESSKLPDMSEYLKDLPMEWFAESNDFFSQTLRFMGLNSQSAQEDSESDAEIRAVVQGTKQVSVPPGFATSTEAMHVLEITQNMANFNIETDTDTSNMPTDTDNSSLPTESEMETDLESVDSIVDKADLEARRLERLVSVIANEGLLCSIKVYCDWITCHPHIIATCAQSSQGLWSRLSVLLNFMPLETDLGKTDLGMQDAVIEIVQKASQLDWYPTHPLMEDIHLREFEVLQEVHSRLQFEALNKIYTAQREEAILRMCCLRHFGYSIAKNKTIMFSYDADKCMFYGPLQPEALQDDKSVQDTMEKMADAEARRNQLMKDMAQLRLQAEVSQLEGSLQSADQPSLPPYLVPDASVLCDNLNQLRQLANSARFIVIIPLAVIDHLDFLKKDCVGAREAIRWLEAEFHKGNRYVRAQKNHEKAATVPHKNLKKKDRDAWRFVQLVDCCKYLSGQSSDCDPRNMVCILTNHTVTSPNISLRVKQALQSAQQEGLMVQNASEFHAKWKEVWKSSKG